MTVKVLSFFTASNLLWTYGIIKLKVGGYVEMKYKINDDLKFIREMFELSQEEMS